MVTLPTAGATRLGRVSALAVVGLGVAYLGVLGVGLGTLPAPEVPIQDPWFTTMEVLIVALGPALVGLSSALFGWVPPERRSWALLSALFMAATAVTSSALHFCILVLRRGVASSHPEWSRWLFAFEWPSVAYAVDVLAWDVFFPIAALSAAVALPPGRATRSVRGLLVASGVLALVGLAGAPLADMRVRNLGILGYAVVFPVAAAFLVRLFGRPAA
jgi:hypothetical protein